mmetsp:Transcript_80014/g.180511  ORF Transcript_80014/g.180511 Transcript_80014/m.180511 type:complete len:203 (+) Transcript_80014:1571-2179(+)
MVASAPRSQSLSLFLRSAKVSLASGRLSSASCAVASWTPAFEALPLSLPLPLPLRLPFSLAFASRGPLSSAPLAAMNSLQALDLLLTSAPASSTEDATALRSSELVGSEPFATGPEASLTLAAAVSAAATSFSSSSSSLSDFSCAFLRIASSSLIRPTRSLACESPRSHSSFSLTFWLPQLSSSLPIAPRSSTARASSFSSC